MKTETVVKLETEVFISDNESADYLSEDELRACRICLATDRRLYDLHENLLVQRLEDLCGTPVSSNDRLPQHICNICSMLLKKYSELRALCRQTQIYLQDVMVKNPVLTTNLIRDLNQPTICSLTKTKTLAINYQPNDIEDSSEIKTETFHFPPLDTNSPLDDSFEDIDAENEIKIEEHNTNICVIVNEIKIEHDTNVSENEKQKHEVANEIKQREIEIKNTENKVKGAAKGKVKNTKGKKNEAEKKPSKKLYNRRTEEDFVGFAKQYNVEVVFLTKEQQTEELQARKDSEAYKKSRFHCELCYTGFIKESSFKKHKLRHDPSAGDHVCDICQTRYSARPKLLSHLRDHRIRFVCKICNKTSKQSVLAKEHFQWHEGYQYTCQHCARKFNKHSTYLNHCRENHTKINCDVCQQPMSGTRGLAAHKAMAHSGTFKCESCEVGFNTKEALARHSEATNYCERSLRPCPQCGVTFATDQRLVTHLEQDHNNKTFKCEECNSAFNSDHHLAMHWSRSHKDLPQNQKRNSQSLICEICAKTFPNMTILKYHQRIHSGEKPFQCAICSKSFRAKINLKVHLNTHTGDRPYKCPLCPETFKSYSQKHKHRLLVHTKERRYKCHMCDKSYVVSWDLKMHIRTFHMKMPFPPRKNPRRSKRSTDQPGAL